MKLSYKFLLVAGALCELPWLAYMLLHSHHVDRFDAYREWTIGVAGIALSLVVMMTLVILSEAIASAKGWGVVAPSVLYAFALLTITYLVGSSLLAEYLGEPLNKTLQPDFARANWPTAVYFYLIPFLAELCISVATALQARKQAEEEQEDKLRERAEDAENAKARMDAYARTLERVAKMFPNTATHGRVYAVIYNADEPLTLTRLRSELDQREPRNAVADLIAEGFVREIQTGGVNRYAIA